MTAILECPTSRRSGGKPPQAATIRVAVHASDPISRIGLTSLLTRTPGVEVLRSDAAGRTGSPKLTVVAIDRYDRALRTTLRRLTSESGAPIVLIAADISEKDTAETAELGVVAVLARRDVTAERLARALCDHVTGRTTAAGGITETARRLTRTRGRGPVPDMNTLSEREQDVLRLVADGLDTAAIARRLDFSESTIKNALGSTIQRFNVRNRAQAVAYAIRTGLI